MNAINTNMERSLRRLRLAGAVVPGGDEHKAGAVVRGGDEYETGAAVCDGDE